MIVNIQQSVAGVFHNVREKKVAKPSTYKERVNADRIAMLIMLVITIAFAIVVA